MRARACLFPTMWQGVSDVGFTVESEVNINIDRLVKKVHSDKLGIYAASSWHRLYSPYVPFDSGMLQNTVRISPWEVQHTVPYAYKMYNGRFNFKRDKHPRASRKWDKAAAPTQKPKLVRELQAFIDRGGLNLGR